MRRALALLTLGLLLTFATQPGELLAAKANRWKVPGDFATIQEAIDSPLVLAGDEIRVRGGTHAGALVDKSVKIKGEDGTVIDDGPVHGSGFIQGFRLLADSDGTTISHLTFRTDFAIMNGAAVDDIIVTHNTIENALQAISNWGGSGWTIDHNKFEDLRTSDGGGIAILVADFAAGTIEDNLVTHNKISGTLHVSVGDGGGYSGTGIVLFADFRWGRSGATAIQDNLVTHNKVELESDTPATVDVWAFELTDTRDDRLFLVLCDNVIEHNDFKKTSNTIALTPAALEDCNTFSKNKAGRLRGHRARNSSSPIPNAFGPDM